MGQRLAGKTAIVTGAGQGIGKGIALYLAGEGADIAVAEYNEETAAATAAEVEQSGRRALACPLDISDAGSVSGMVDEVASRFGHVDILVNNAGVVQTKPMLDLTEEDWDRVISVNLRGTFFCLQAVARRMIDQAPDDLKRSQAPTDIFSMDAGEPEQTPRSVESCGKIVNLASISGRRGRPLSTHYAASKAAIISVTQSAALALAPYNINVNAVAPGVVPTPMWEAIDQDRAALFDARPGEAMAAFIRTIPLQRASSPRDIAAAIAFLCSSEADYITGQTLNVDGGYEMD